jgi:hypothetical protein
MGQVAWPLGCLQPARHRKVVNAGPSAISTDLESQTNNERRQALQCVQEGHCRERGGTSVREKGGGFALAWMEESDAHLVAERH